MSLQFSTVLTAAQTDKFLQLSLGVFVWNGVSLPWGETEIGHVLWTAKATVQDKAFSMGGVVERWSRVSTTDASHEISKAVLATA